MIFLLAAIQDIVLISRRLWKLIMVHGWEKKGRREKLYFSVTGCHLGSFALLKSLLVRSLDGSETK